MNKIKKGSAAHSTTEASFSLNRPVLRKGTKTEFWVSASNGRVIFGSGGVVGINKQMQWEDTSSSPVSVLNLQARSRTGAGVAKWKICPAVDCVQMSTRKAPQFINLENLHLEVRYTTTPHAVAASYT